MLNKMFKLFKLFTTKKNITKLYEVTPHKEFKPCCSCDDKEATITGKRCECRVLCLECYINYDKKHERGTRNQATFCPFCKADLTFVKHTQRPPALRSIEL